MTLGCEYFTYNYANNRQLRRGAQESTVNRPHMIVLNFMHCCKWLLLRKWIDILL